MGIFRKDNFGNSNWLKLEKSRLGFDQKETERLERLCNYETSASYSESENDDPRYEEIKREYDNRKALVDKYPRPASKEAAE